MATVIASDPVPLRLDSKGGIRVGSTRVTLELVIAAFLDGASAEDIVSMFDTLDLGDVYSVLGYYLRHKDEVQEYLRDGCTGSKGRWLVWFRTNALPPQCTNADKVCTMRSSQSVLPDLRFRGRNPLHILLLTIAKVRLQLS